MELRHLRDTGNIFYFVCQNRWVLHTITHHLWRAIHLFIVVAAVVVVLVSSIRSPTDFCCDCRFSTHICMHAAYIWRVCVCAYRLFYGWGYTSAMPNAFPNVQIYWAQLFNTHSLFQRAWIAVDILLSHAHTHSHERQRRLHPFIASARGVDGAFNFK